MDISIYLAQIYPPNFQSVQWIAKKSVALARGCSRRSPDIKYDLEIISLSSGKKIVKASDVVTKLYKITLLLFFFNCFPHFHPFRKLGVFTEQNQTL